MNKDCKIRRAILQDVDGIVRVKRAAWPEEEPDRDLVAAVLGSPDHSTFVVEKQGVIAGFVDGFMTRRGNKARWEVDLLAIAPDSRGERLGEALVRANCAVGYGQGAATCRALIQVNNIASQKTFSRCDFVVQDAPHLLFVTTEGYASQVQPDAARQIIPVVTMNYRGIWLESRYMDADFAAAKAAIGRSGGATAGAVIPETQHEGCQAAAAHGFVSIGVYHWWHHHNG